MKSTTLASLLLAATMALPSVGCVVQGRAHAHVVAPVAVVEVEEEPPPPRTVVVETRPGFIWIEGRWVRHGNRWVWNDGRWERERVGYRWEQGRWERRGRGHVWVEGRWVGGGGRRDDGPRVRDHRGGGPVIRDHR